MCVRALVSARSAAQARDPRGARGSPGPLQTCVGPLAPPRCPLGIPPLPSTLSRACYTPVRGTRQFVGAFVQAHELGPILPKPCTWRGERKGELKGSSGGRRELPACRRPGGDSAPVPPAPPRVQSKGAFTMIAPHASRRVELARQQKVGARRACCRSAPCARPRVRPVVAWFAYSAAAIRSSPILPAGERQGDQAALDSFKAQHKAEYTVPKGVSLARA